MSDDTDWAEIQDNEIESARASISARRDVLDGGMEVGILNGDHIQSHENGRLEAYLQGHADGMEFAEIEVQCIDNVVPYARDYWQTEYGENDE